MGVPEERRGERFGALIGRSPAMERVCELLGRVASKETTVLIEGESGTGKELAARSIHHASRRAAGPFVVVDCGALPPHLVESELYGHERGAFTGASSSRAGAFEVASGGTVLLDEVGELPAEVQPKLLRVLECGEVKPLGADEVRRVDVRILAATNRDLEAEVAAGRFREDLYYRLAVVRVALPPLRRRREDIPLLVRHFASCCDASALGRIGPDLMATFVKQDWPGNVRELRNAVERFLVMPELGPEAVTELSARPRPGQGSDLGSLLDLPYHEARMLWSERFERAYLAAKLEAAEGVVSRAAELAGVPRQTFHRLLRKHGLRTGHTPTPSPVSAGATRRDEGGVADAAPPREADDEGTRR